MSVHEFALPDLGEGLTEAEILSWRVPVGGRIALNDPLVEVETAKAAVEIPSPFAGRVAEILVDAGVPVQVGTAIVRIDDGDDGDGGDGEGGDGGGGAEGREPLLVGYGVSGERRTRRRRSSAAVPPAAPSVPAPPSVPTGAPRHPRVKPPLRKFAKERGIDLATIEGSGPGGTITRLDVMTAFGPTLPAGGASPATVAADDRRFPVRGVRAATARAMLTSARIPQVTVFHTADVTATVELVAELRRLPEFADVKISVLLLVARALLRACRTYPDINASWEGGTGNHGTGNHGTGGDGTGEGAVRVVHGSVHLGVAADTERGLVVPNIKNADRLSLVELARSLADLVETARAGRHSPADLTGGTITITNVGVFGVDVGAPLLNPGEGAILCAGAIQDRPWVHDGALAVRSVMQLALTVDHRIIDGGLASRALADLADTLTHPLRALL